MNQHINQHQRGTAGSQYSSRETGYVSDGGNPDQPISVQNYPQGYQPGIALAAIPVDQVIAPFVPQPMGNGLGSSYTKGDSTYMERSEVETEIFWSITLDSTPNSIQKLYNNIMQKYGQITISYLLFEMCKIRYKRSED